MMQKILVRIELFYAGHVNGLKLIVGALDERF